MKVYRAIRDIDGRPKVIVEEEGALVGPLPHRERHSPGGFEWGYGGSGPADLARSLLWDVLGCEPDPEEYQAFKWDVVAKLPHEGWILTERYIRAWHEFRALKEQERYIRAWYTLHARKEQEVPDEAG